MKKDILIKLSALALASSMLMSAASCGKKDSSSEHKHDNMVGNIDDNANADAEDMPPAVVLLTEAISGVPLKMEYLDQNLSESEAVAVAKYLYGISEKDGEMVKSVMYDGMADYVVESGQSENIQTFTENAYNYFRDMVGEDYEISYLISAMNYSGLDYVYYDNIVRNKEPEAEISGRKTVVLEAYYDTENDSGILQNESDEFVYVIVYTINGQSYVMENVSID